MIKKVVMEFSHGEVEMYTRGITKLTWEMAMAKCIGMTEVFIKVYGRKESSMDKVRYMFLAKAIKKDYLKTMFWW